MCMTNKLTHSERIAIRRNAVVILQHAQARIGKWDAQGWLTGECDHDAVFALQHAQWSLEAMDSLATNRFWNEQRREYDEMLETLEVR